MVLDDDVEALRQATDRITQRAALREQPRRELLKSYLARDKRRRDGWRVAFELVVPKFGMAGRTRAQACEWQG